MQSWQSAPVIGQQPAAQQPRQQTFNADPIVAPAPPSERRAEEDQAMQRQRFELDVVRTQAQIDQQSQANAIKAPSGYRYTPDGNLEAIPGGPAAAARDGGSIPVSAAQVARESVGQYTSLERAIGTFKDDFAGNPVGGLENTTEAYLGIGTEGQSEWWADFRATDNLIRNSLFGASLTEGEKAAYNATTVTPGMRPDKVRDNLTRRAQIVRDALAREKEFYLANGYKPQAVDALFAPLRERPQVAEATPPQFGEGEDTGAALPNAGGTPDSGAAPPPFEPDLRPGAGLDNGDSQQQQGLATGEARREDDPLLSGVRSEYAQRLSEGQTAEEIIRWARSAGINPSAFRSIQEQVQFRDQNPGVPIEQYNTTQLDDRFVQQTAVEQGAGQIIASPLGTFGASAANALSGFTLDNIIGATGGNAERARLVLDDANNRNPVSGALGTVTGGVVSVLGGEAALARAGLRAALPRALAADTAYGAVAGAGATDDGSSRVVGGLQGAAAAAGGSLAGQAVGRGLRNVARGGGDPNVQTLRNAGVNDLTVGQTGSGRVGNVVRGVEDRLSGVPVIGDMVNARRTAGLRQFNQAAFKKALEPIGGDVGDKVGMEAIEEAQNQVSKAYTDALSGVGVVPDAAFDTAFSKSLMGVQSLKRVGPEIFDDVVDVFKSYDADPMLSGEAIDTISRELRNIKAAYKQDPRFIAISKQIDTVERAVFDLADRQASGTVPEYMAARRAYRRLSTLEDAVLKAQNQADNVFTPAQLGRADTANTRRFGGKRAAARGDTPFNELQQAAQDVLPNRVPDSGTAGRLLVPLAAVGAGGGADYASGGNGTGLTIGAIIAGLYSRTGQRLLTKPARGMTPGTRRNSIAQDPRTARALGVLGGASASGALANQQ